VPGWAGRRRSAGLRAVPPPCHAQVPSAPPSPESAACCLAAPPVDPLQRVKTMIAYSQEQGVPAAEAVVGKFAIGPSFFSDRDPMIRWAVGRLICNVRLPC
jgi:hypothetical protein